MKRTREESSPAKASKKEKELATETPGEVISAIGSTVDSKTRGGAAPDADADGDNDATASQPSTAAEENPPKISPDSETPPPEKTRKTRTDGNGAGESDTGGGSTENSSSATAATSSITGAKSTSSGGTRNSMVSVGGAGAGERGGEGGGSSSSSGAGAVREESPADVEGVPNETLFVGNLSYKVSEAVIIKLFTPFGKVVREQFCYHMVGPRRGEPRGFCFVEYSNVKDAAKAIRALHGRKLYGRPLRVRFMTVEGRGRMDYSTSTTTSSSSTSGSTSFGGFTEGGGAKIPPPAGAGGENGVGAGVTKLSLDKKVALLKMKLREASRSGR